MIEPATKKSKERPKPSKRLPGTKVYHNIREVGEMTSLKPYVLRFWETEFPQLRPRLSRGGRRQYQLDDIKTVLMIKKLLYEDGFTIPGARGRLSEIREQDPDQMEISFNQFKERSQLGQITEELKELLKLL
jgi:DNA-binding transcriptional MerR regulator